MAEDDIFKGSEKGWVFAIADSKQGAFGRHQNQRHTSKKTPCRTRLRQPASSRISEPLPARKMPFQVGVVADCPPLQRNPKCLP